MKIVPFNIALFCLLCIFSASLVMAPRLYASTEKQWDFRVFLDDKDIGYHKVKLTSNADKKKVQVEARFDVKFLFITAYQYRHKTEENWKGVCLTDLQSDTEDNGKKLFIRASAINETVRLETHEGENQLQGCVRSFAYWNPELLKATRLLNTQTGEYQVVEVDDLGENLIAINGKWVDAYQYRLRVEGKNIDLWYTRDMDWLALQTTVRGGRILSYFPANRYSQ